MPGGVWGFSPIVELNINNFLVFINVSIVTLGLKKVTLCFLKVTVFSGQIVDI